MYLASGTCDLMTVSAPRPREFSACASARQPSKAVRYWRFLAVLWAFYFLLVFSVGRYPQFTQPLTWGEP